MFTLSKTQLLASLTFSIVVFLNPYFIYSLIFIFFLLLVVGGLFFFFFLQVDYLRFSLFSEEGLYGYELPSEDCF